MLNKKFYFILCFALIIFIIGCSQDTKVYKVSYQGNYPAGAFKFLIGNQTIFTNGNEILKVSVKNNPEFFCYSVNKQVLCKFNLNIETNEDAGKRFVNITQNLKGKALSSGKNRTILHQRINYYLNSKKLDSEDVIYTSDLTGEIPKKYSIPALGKGITEKKSKDDALKNSKEIIKVLTDNK